VSSMGILNNLPAAMQPYFWPVLGIIVMFMGFAALLSFQNPGLRAAVKEHFVWIIVSAILIFGGGALLTNFLRAAGAG
jgi:hypothetical protein